MSPPPTPCPSYPIVYPSSFPPSLPPTSSAVTASPASGPFGVHPIVLVLAQPWPCPVIITGLVLLTSVALITHQALCPTWCPTPSLVWFYINVLPWWLTPITVVSQEAVDGPSKQSELLSLMFSLSYPAQIGPYTAWYLVEFWVTHIWTEPRLYPRTTCSSTQDLSLTGIHNLNYFYFFLFWSPSVSQQICAKFSSKNYIKWLFNI